MSFLQYQKQNPEFLNNYLKYKRWITYSAKTTIDEAYFDLRTFFRYLKLYFYMNDDLDEITVNKFKEITIKDISLNDMNNVTSSVVMDFLVFLKYTLNNSPKTRNKKLASIKRLFEYLETNNLITINPTIDIESATLEKRNPKFLTLSESKKLLSTTIKSDSKNKIRNYAITCMFLNCSIRLSELVGINISSIKFDEKTIKVCGKGNKERILYLNEAVIEALTKYLDVRPKLDKSFKDYNALFLSSRNKRISRRTVQSIIDTEIKNTFKDTKENIHTHSLRHSSATMMYNNNTDILVIKRILGHSSLAATEIYTHVSKEKLRYVMENCTISSILERKEEELKNDK